MREKKNEKGGRGVAYCKHCKVEILDETKVCPFCQNRIKEDERKGEDSYPDIRMKRKAYRFVLNIFFFLAIIVCVAMLAINLFYYKGEFWSILPIGIVCYSWFAIRYCIFNNVNVGAKIMLQLILTQVLLVFIDWRMDGYTGWSVNFAFPALILIADGAILILMAANFMNWQSYLLYQIQLLLLSLWPLILYLKHWITKPIPTFIAIFISFVIFLGTMVFGNTKAKDELLRRFHI